LAEEKAMASDIKLVGDNVIIEGSVGIGTNNPITRLHVENSEIHSGGNLGGLSFGDRTKPGERWVWYAMDGKARLWFGNDQLIIGDGRLDAGMGVFNECFVRAALKGGFLGRSQLCIRSHNVILQDPAFKDKDTTLGVALAHTDKDELLLNENGGYKGGVRITGKLTVDDGYVHADGVFTHSIHTESVILKNSNFKDEVPRLALAHTAQDELALNSNGDYKGGVKITGKVTVNGNVQVNGVLTQSSSRELKENITPFSGHEAVQALGGLNPVKFFYKDSEHKEQRVGFVAEESPGLVTASGRKAVAVMDVVAVLTKVVQQQQEVISRLGDEVTELRRKCEQLLDARPQENLNA
jgi:phage baseplate assembly protein gpV